MTSEYGGHILKLIFDIQNNKFQTVTVGAEQTDSNGSG